MEQEPVGKRKFTEKEANAILRRATELQSQEEGTSLSDGTSLEQLQQAAAELGIKPHLISQAAADLANGNTRRPSSFWGAPMQVQMESIVPHRISEENWPTILNDMRHVSGRVGDSHMVGKSFEWTSISPDTYHVSVTPHGEQSRVTATSQYGEWALAFYLLPLIVAFGTAMGVTHSTSFSGPVDAAVILGIFAIAFGIGNLGFTALAKGRRRTVQNLMSVLETAPEQTTSVTQSTVTEVQPVASYQTSSETAAQATQPVMQVLNKK